MAEGVTDEEACRLIALHPVAARSGGALGGDLAGWTDGEGLWRHACVFLLMPVISLVYHQPRDLSFVRHNLLFLLRDDDATPAPNHQHPIIFISRIITTTTIHSPPSSAASSS